MLACPNAARAARRGGGPRVWRWCWHAACGIGVHIDGTAKFAYEVAREVAGC